MKKLRFAVLIIAVCILLSSCVGIGDGALFDNITTREPIEEITQPEGAVVCKLVAYYPEGKEIMDNAIVIGDEAREIYEYLADSSNYTNVVEEVAMSHPYIRVTFEGIADTEEYSVRSNDNVDINDTLLLWGRTGHLEGAYAKLFDYIEKYGGSKGYFCNISTSDAPHARIRASGENVYNMFITLMEGNYRDYTTYTTWDYPTAYATSTYQALGDYINLAFFGSENMTYVIFSNDMVYKFDSSSDDGELYAPVGVLGGIYIEAKALLESFLDKVTEAEKEAGAKLNCLYVVGVNDSAKDVYINYSVSMFKDIGCIYMKKLGNYDYILYFESCSREELSEKVAILEEHPYIQVVAMVSVSGYDDTSPLD